MSHLKFKLNRDFVLVTEEGPSFRFKKGEPVLIPKRYVSKVVEIGAEAVDSDASDADAEVRAEMEREAAADAQRLDRLRDVLGKMIERNNSGDFTAGGKPNKKKVELMFGGEVSDKEVAAVFEQMKQEM